MILTDHLLLDAVHHQPPVVHDDIVCTRTLALTAAQHLAKLLASPNFDKDNDRHWHAADALWHGALLARQAVRIEARAA